jgi:Gluconate 2-dehydrogenase subunit 3
MPQGFPTTSRREIIKRGVGLLTVAAAGGIKMLTPAQARSESIPFRVFDRAEVEIIDALGEILLPGSAASGLAHFVDFQLAGPASDSMLMIKYLGLNPPFTDFYKSGIAALDNSAHMKFLRPFGALEAKDASAMVAAMAKGDIAGWNGPPAPLFFFVMRNDAVDVTYGTTAGFETLAIPYMAHIAPLTPWGA